MTTTLNHLAKQAVAYTADDPYYRLGRRDLMVMLDVKGTENEHLANPLNRDPNVWYARDRETPLTGEEAVHGDFLLLNYCGHDPSMKLEDFPGLEELEAAILGGGGITNMFTSQLLAFLGGRLAPYDVYHDASSGERVKFNKREQNGPGPKTGYPNLEIRWQSR